MPQKRQIRNPELTKAKILAAAVEEFARYGLAGTRIEAIATRCNLTKAMICYYFESKEGLYRAVLQLLVDELSAAFEHLHRVLNRLVINDCAEGWNGLL